MMNFTVTVLLFFTTLISAVHGWTTINNPTAVLLSPPISSSSRYCSTINNNNAVVVDVLVRRRRQSRRLFVLSAISASSSTSTADTSTTTEPIEDCDQQHDYDECIIDEDMLLSDCAELESFISSATASTATTTTAFPDTDHTTTATTATTATTIMIEDTIYEQLHDDNGKSLLSTITIPIDSTTNAPARTSTSSRRPTAAPAPYYEFNKALVNTMYTIISFLYPTDAAETTTTDDDYTIISLSQKEKQHIQQQQIQNQLRRNYEHFYILEIIARVPYFAYLSCMHLQETFGSRYGNTDTTDNSSKKNMNYDNTADQVRIEKMRLFYAQADNELHHLLIIEDLLGLSSGKKSLSNKNNEEKKKKDHRTIIGHTLASMYYWYTVFVYMTHGKVGGEQAVYNLNELFVDRVYDTYTTFLTQNENELKKTSSVSNNNVVPDIAYKYYDTDNQYLLNLLYSSSSSSSSSSKSSIQPNNDIRNNKHKPLSNLYDVFMNIRNDEKEHYNTLCKLQQQPQQ